jgi:hypothetical protein
MGREALVSASLVVGLLVGWDAHRIGLRYGWPSGRDASLGPVGWALFVAMIPITVAVYAVRRHQFLAWRRRSGAAPETR